MTFDGVGAALATFFDDRHEVDVAATAAHAERLVDAGVRGVVVAGSTGEAATLTGPERARLIAGVRERVGDRVPVVAGTGGAWRGAAVAFTAEAREAGAAAVLVLSAPRAADQRPYYRAVVDAAGGLPVLAYHFPAVSPPGIPMAALPELGELGVAGVKDSSGDPDRLLRTARNYGGDVYVGSSALLVQAGAIDCRGAILAAANLEPALCVAAFAGDGDAQRRLADAHVTAATDFPRGLKAALAERHGTSPVCRTG